MENNKIKVFIKINDKNEIIDIGSDIFIKDTSGWIEVDEGGGDKYAHAQNYYLPKPLRNQNDNYNYMFIDNKIIEKDEN